MYIFILNICCFKLCNNYQKSFNPSTIRPLATISKVISNQHRKVKWEKRGRVFFCCFPSALKNRLLRTVTMVKITLMEIPCTRKYFRDEKKPHRNWINKGEMRSTKKTGTFPFAFYFKLENPNSLEGENDILTQEKS